MSPPTDLAAVLQSLTLEEKVVLSWDSGGEAQALTHRIDHSTCWKKLLGDLLHPRQGTICQDGPNGARGGDFTGTCHAACFPAASCLAATFEPVLARKVGEALAREARTKGAQCLLAPTTCVHRHPLGGRNFESFSEDVSITRPPRRVAFVPANLDRKPLVSGRFASQIIQGLQQNGIAAVLKHFAVNEQETERMRIDTIVSQRALREIYLRPFEIAVKEASPWAVMTAYNKLNGDHCDSSQYLLEKVLRNDWEWDGLVMSDWGGTNSSVEALNAGLDLEMPGPTIHRKAADILELIQSGQALEEAVDRCALALLKFLKRVGAFDNLSPQPETSVDRLEDRKLIREVAGKGAVLLKNDKDILPLSKDKVRGKNVALIGLAKTWLGHGGGSAAVKAHYSVTAWDGLKEALGDVAQLHFAKGAHTSRFLAPLINDENKGTVVGMDGQPGWTRHLYAADTSELTETKHGERSPNTAPFNPETFSKIVEFACDFTPKETGPHYFAISGVGPTHFYIDGEFVSGQDHCAPDAMGFIFGVQEDREHIHYLCSGTSYRLRLRTVPPNLVPGLEILQGRPGLRLGMSPGSEHDADLQALAVKAASAADYAIVFTGNEFQWETEGQDQLSFNLPKNGTQDTLVSAVASVNSNVIIVNSTGVPVSMPWLNNVSAVVQAWFGGQEAGNAIADVLTGVVNPEGHLPTSFPARIEDSPAFGKFPGTYDQDGQPVVEYKEGVFVGYRHYDRLSCDKVNFPFGHGLSYTRFNFTGLESAMRETEILISVNVENVGQVYGRTLVQVYAGFSQKDPFHPIKNLVAFEMIGLEPRQSEQITLQVPIRDLAYFDEARDMWVARAGEYEISIGRSVADIIQRVTVMVAEEMVFSV
ncbi:hypothetical protein NW762_006169 [Fusarium torreyae]|uniref:beta-glucosidase n=1 Tax=Fusarium torreyae TaxID=1237075 RepID=A0A9W8S1H9_9HYPO|nr:hypothetical protein NW762_006169 [Fusarium torreyae]